MLGFGMPAQLPAAAAAASTAAPGASQICLGLWLIRLAARLQAPWVQSLEPILDLRKCPTCSWTAANHSGEVKLRLWSLGCRLMPLAARLQVRQTHPDLTIILYISGSGGLLERMAAAKPDVISIDQRVAMQDAIARIGPDFAVQVRMGLLKCAAVHVFGGGPGRWHLPHRPRVCGPGACMRACASVCV